uniref:Uncharacterized protein n=1 Tax=Anguilla anguilla TaxID=7936 RepID=A0A0E9VIP1_ANGAN
MVLSRLMFLKSYVTFYPNQVSLFNMFDAILILSVPMNSSDSNIYFHTKYLVQNIDFSR